MAAKQGKLAVIHSANTLFRKNITLIININDTVVIVVIISVLAVAFLNTQQVKFTFNSRLTTTEMT
jgi:hypothetical protein